MLLGRYEYLEEFLGYVCHDRVQLVSRTETNK